MPPVTNPKDSFASFHPIKPDPPTKVKRPRTSSGKIKIKLELLRTTRVDSKCMQCVNSTIPGCVDGVQTLAEGTIERLTRGSDWIAWSGVIVVPGDVRCGGFAACRVEVFDQLVLSILPTSSSRSTPISFCESVPVKLAAMNSLGTFTGSTSTIKLGDPKKMAGMDFYPPPPTSSSVASNNSWASSDGGHC